jgi:hypothetical protein
MRKFISLIEPLFTVGDLSRAYIYINVLKIKLFWIGAGGGHL